MRRARRGDASAYERLVERHQEIAYRSAYLRLGSEAAAQDATQEALVKAYYALPRFRLGAPFRPWLLEIVANEARNVRRSEARYARLALRKAGDRTDADAVPSPELAAVEGERREALLDALLRLRPDDRLVIAHRYFLDLSEAEMAELDGVARGTVKSRLARALGRLRASLDDHALTAYVGERR